MREMKDSGIEWIGEIPKEWEISILSTIFKEHKKKNIGLIENNLLSLSYGRIVRKSLEDNNGLLPTSFETYNVIKKGHIVFRLTDLQNDKRSLRTGLCKEKGIITSAYVTLAPIDNDDTAYMHYLFYIYDICKVFYGMGDGVRQSITFNDLKALKVIVPPLSTQHRIADYLDDKCGKIDRYIEQQKQVIEKLKAYKQSVITEAVTKGLDPTVPMKDSGVEWIGEIPEGWEVTKIKKYCKLKTGTTPSTSNTDWFDGDFQWFTPGDFRENYILDKSSRCLSERAKEDGVAVMVPHNTVLIVGIGATAGKIGYTTVDCSFNQQITAISSKNVLSKYLMYWMIANTKFLRDTALFTTLPILNNQTIGDYILIFPRDHKEQELIVQYLDNLCISIDSSIKEKQTLLEKLTEYKKSLIYEVVTGKKEV